MKKNLFILLLPFMPVGLMAQQTLVTDPDTGLQEKTTFSWSTNHVGSTARLVGNAAELTIDVTNEAEKTVDVSELTGLQRLNVTGATSVILPDPIGSTFTLDGTGSPDLVVDFGTQTTLETLTLINMNQVDISDCSALQTLNCEGKGSEWGDGTDGHKGLVCNTGASSGSWTLPALTTINASNSGVQKLDMTNAAANLANLNICNSTMKELRVPNHTEFTAISNTSSPTGLSLGFSSVDTKNYYGKVSTDTKWYSEGEFCYNQLEVLDISGCSEISGPFWVSADGGLNYNESPLREFYASGCSKITRIVLYNSPLTAIDVSYCPKMTHLWVEQTHIETIDLSGCSSLTSFNAKRNRLTNLDFLTMPCTGRTAADIAKLANIQVNGGVAASKMKDENGNEKVVIREIFTNKISKLSTTHLGSALQTLMVADNLLEKLEVHEGLTGIKSFQCENNMLLTLDLSKLPTDKLTKGMWGWDVQNNVMQVGFLNVEVVKGVPADGSKDWVAMHLPNGGGLDHTLDNNVKLFPTIEDANAGTNEIAEKATPYMGTIANFIDKMKYTVTCSEGYTGEHLFLHSQDDIKSDNGGKIADQDLYGKVLRYKYNTMFNGGNPLVVGNSVIDNHIEIRAHIWPYILNINPATKEDLSDVNNPNPTGTNYYSSTIYLDYDALIPDGVKVYVATGFQSGYQPIGQPEDAYDAQLVLREVGVPGDVLPAKTPVIVTSDAAGLYSFKTVWEFDFKGWEDFRQNDIKNAYAEQTGVDPASLMPVLHGVDENNIIYKPEFDPTIAANREKWVNLKNGGINQTYLDNNILSGTLTDSTVTKKSILTLGRQKAPDAEGNVSLKLGFWRFNGTSLPAHRCFIAVEDLRKALENANISNSKEGGAFYFGYNDVIITDIEAVATEPQKTEQVVYDLQGRRVVGKPAPGIYIVNGKKVVVKQ